MVCSKGPYLGSFQIPRFQSLVLVFLTAEAIEPHLTLLAGMEYSIRRTTFLSSFVVYIDTGPLRLILNFLMAYYYGKSERKGKPWNI